MKVPKTFRVIRPKKKLTKQIYQARWNHMFRVLQEGVATGVTIDMQDWDRGVEDLLTQDPWFKRQGFQRIRESFCITESEAGGGFEALAEFFLPQPPDFYSRGSLYALFMGTPGLYKKALQEITLADFLLRAREVYGRVFSPKQEGRR